MKLKYIFAYKNLENYYKVMKEKDNSWEEIMIEPFWKQIAEYVPMPSDYLKPGSITDDDLIQKQIEAFRKADFSKYEKDFAKIIERLPKDDEDPMTIAFYPSGTDMIEGVFGTGVWGNIIINVNPLCSDFEKWIPFVFAHEYHHNVLGFYWYCILGGKQTKGNLLEMIINEGEADEFAKSMYANLKPSWHEGVYKEEEKEVWEKFKPVLLKQGSPEEFAPYLFGDEKLGIPPYAGYYFASRIVQSFMKKNPQMTFAELIKVPHQVILDESEYTL